MIQTVQCIMLEYRNYKTLNLLMKINTPNVHVYDRLGIYEQIEGVCFQIV